MKKNYLFVLFAILCFAGKTVAQNQLIQPCYSDEMTKRLHAMDPKIIQGQKNYYEHQINESLKKINFRKVPLTTELDESGNPSFWYDIPVVVHIIHDYNADVEYLSDNFIFDALNDWNVVYAKQNSDTADVITPFKKWIGNPHIRLHLATVDPNGNPTHGITRHRSYLTYIGGDQSKIDDWNPASYVNIWSVNQMDAANGFAAAYAYWPAEAAGIPFWDGIICLSSYIDNGGGTSPGNGNSYKTINHEMGHVFNLLHPWGSTNTPYAVSLSPGNVTGPAADEAATPCGDDGVDDTPPTRGHYLCNCSATAWPYSFSSSVTAAEQSFDEHQNGIYDTVCAENYFVIYTNAAGGDSLVNYPDTTDVQNIMDYSYCAKMFTIGQVARMHAALNSTIANRTNLWDTANLIATGVLNADSNAFLPRVDILPTPEFTAINSASYPNPNTYMNKMGYFTFPGTNVYFFNETWNDTLTSLTWTFSNGAAIPSTTVTSFVHPADNEVINSFTQSGWVDLKMAATGNNTGTNTVDWPQAIFVADATGTPATGYFQEWEPNGDYQKWPSFNYYNNEFFWSIDTTVGFDDHYCMKYKGYDNRIVIDAATNTYIYPTTGTPYGDFDDFFSVPMDLSAFSSGCNLDFMYAGATRSSTIADVNDSLEIDYTVNNGATWKNIVVLSQGTLINNGPIATEFVPTTSLNWSPMTIPLPAGAITSYTTFRFRYLPKVGQDGFSSGNDFYMDRISFGNNPASVNNVKLNDVDVAVVPNPTDGDAYVVIKDAASNVTAQITVTDITGKVVYTINQLVIGGQAQILIPHDVIAVPGMYLVQATTGSQSQTKKLVVY